MSRDMSRRPSAGALRSVHSTAPAPPMYDLFPATTNPSTARSRSRSNSQAKSTSGRSRSNSVNRPMHIANVSLDSANTHSQMHSQNRGQSRNRSRSNSVNRPPHIANASVDSTASSTATRHAMPIMSPPQKASSHFKKPSGSAPADTVRVFVGPEQQEFLVNRALLCACSPFFGDHLSRGTNQLSLPTETSSMFELFAVWLHSPARFPKHLQRALRHVSPEPGRAIDSADASSRLHWTLVRLHLFAAMLELLPLQDLAMDAIQDLYLRRDWDVTPRFVRFLYTQCDPFASLRIRRWAVAMVAYSLAIGVNLPQGADTEGAGYSVGPRHMRAPSTGEKDAKAFYTLLARYPEFNTDYSTHLRKMEESGLDMAMKNPQLRIPSNTLRNDQRRFAFRQCAFHTHRATAGQGTCPYGGDEDNAEGRIGLIRKKSRRARQQRRQMELAVQLEKQREHQALVVQQQQQEEEADRMSRSRSRSRGRSRAGSMSRPVESELPAVPQISSSASVRARSRSISRPHISQLALSGIPESFPDMSDLELPPMLPATTYGSRSSSPRNVHTTARTVRHHVTKSYSSSVYSHAAATPAVPIAMPPMPSFPLTDFSAPVPEAETPSTTPPPYLRPPASVIPASAKPTVRMSLEQQIKEQTAKLAHHNASLRASSVMQSAHAHSVPMSPPSGHSSPSPAASPSSLASLPSTVYAPSSAYGTSSSASAQFQKHQQAMMLARPSQAPARIEDYRNRRLPDPPESPVYHLDMPDFDFDFDAEIQSLSALCPSVPHKNHRYALNEGAVDELLDEVAIALHIAQYAAAAPMPPTSHSHHMRMTATA